MANYSSQRVQEYINDDKHQIKSELTGKKLGSTALRHIFQGEIEANTSGIVVAQGLHSLVEQPNNVKIMKTIEKLDKNGVYIVKLAMTDLTTGKIYTKRSTMFPHTWSKQRIIYEIESVLPAITIFPATTSSSYCVLKKTSSNGIPLNIIFQNGLPLSAYPTWKKNRKYDFD
ncbi:unnamed protein product [Rotaria sp. Silwood2]|nr:unnamed protein product [Rotaria sp. Silwood2]CAF4315169.1 unnamed protein product [Rotaria sp. Silwood2]